MSSSQINGLLGLAMRSGNIAVGAHPVMQALAKGKARLILFSGRAGDATVRKFTYLAQDHNLCAIRVADDNLGDIIGKPDCVVFAITQEGFARSILQKLQGSPNEEDTHS